MIHGYCRCSTNDKKQDVSRQVHELKEMGADLIYKEYASGMKNDRKEYKKMLAALKEGDTIVATEVSRLTRSTSQLCELLQLVQDKHLKLDIKNSLTVDCTVGTLDAYAKAMVTIAGVFAELERSIIADRVKSGLAVARMKGKHIGRVRVTAKNIPVEKVQCLKKWVPEWQSGNLTKVELARLCKVSKPTLNKYIALLSDAGIINLKEDE